MTANFPERALAYATAGFEVVRLGPQSKTPTVRRGVYAATTSQTVIRAWWDEQPCSNIGLRVPAGCILLDIDPRNGGTVDQVAEFGRTTMAETGGGGWHLLYRFDRPVRGLVKGTDGVEIKGRSQYFVAAPSVHPITGRTYRWIDLRPPVHLPPAAWPRVAQDGPGCPVSPTFQSRSARRWDGLERTVKLAGPGKRNSTLYWALRRALEAQAPGDLLERLRVAAESSGLSSREIDGVCRSALGGQRE